MGGEAFGVAVLGDCLKGWGIGVIGCWFDSISMSIHAANLPYPFSSPT